MSATLVSSNTTIKVNAAINVANTGTPGTLYTAPSNGYAIVQLVKTTTFGVITYSIAGRPVFTANASLSGFASGIAFYVGPSQSVSWTSSTGENPTTVFVVGVEFVNTP